MAGNVLPFGLTRAQAETLIRDLASANKFVIEPYFRQRLKERGITMSQVLRALKEGHMDQGPKRDEHGDWRCRVRKRVAGRRVRVVVGISGGLGVLYLITTY